MKLFIVIPALNEEKTIAQVIGAIPHAVDGITSIQPIIINDGSGDKTAEYAEKAGVPPSGIISHEKPRGLGAVFQRGIHEALSRGADIVVTIDGDGQFDPRDIPQLVAPIVKNKADFVSCSRFKEKQYVPKMPFVKKMGNYGMAWFINFLVKQKITDAACGFRAYSREALLNLNLFGKFTYTQETLLDLIFKGLRYKEVALKVRGQREFGKSRVARSLFQYAYQTLKIIFRCIRDYKPLKFIGGFGIFLFLIGTALDAFILRHYIATHQFTPYKAIAFIGGFLNAMGILIFVIGLVADMLDRMRITHEKILYFEKRRFYSATDSQNQSTDRGHKRLIAGNIIDSLTKYLKG